MVMPGGMSGADLTAEAHRTYPEIRVLFTSDYAELEVIRRAGTQSHNCILLNYAGGSARLSQPPAPTGLARPMMDPVCPFADTDPNATAPKARRIMPGISHAELGLHGHPCRQTFTG